MNIKLLIAEDSIAAAAIMEEQISRKDPEVTIIVTPSFSQTLRLMSTFRPDVLILDLGLSDYETDQTVDALPLLRTACPECKIIATTADTKVTRELLLSKGADDFMDKSAGRTGTQLMDRIRKVCTS